MKGATLVSSTSGTEPISMRRLGRVVVVTTEVGGLEVVEEVESMTLIKVTVAMLDSSVVLRAIARVNMTGSTRSLLEMTYSWLHVILIETPRTLSESPQLNAAPDSIFSSLMVI